MDAELVRALAPRQNVLAWSGVQRSGSELANQATPRTYWLVLTPINPAAPVHFELPVADTHVYSICDLTTGESRGVNATRGALQITADRRGPGYSSSYVLLVSNAPQTAAACNAVALAPSTWLPVQRVQ